MSYQLASREIQADSVPSGQHATDIGFQAIVGRSAPLLQAIKFSMRVATRRGTTVLIVGETGTGKGLFARGIHYASPEAQEPFVTVNCAAIPANLLESELFGHERGAFTDARARKLGLLELAGAGTLFLDEISEMTPSLQVALLRTLQTGEYSPVGSSRSRYCDVRIIAATNRDLKREVEERRFREDLYYRLNVFPVEVPPLRKRKEDIPLLAAHFLELAARKFNHPKPKLSQAKINHLQGYDWPGNIRELQNVIERAVITARSGRFHFDLPTGGETYSASPPVRGEGEAYRILTFEEIKQLDRDNILKALKKSGGKVFGTGGAAELLDTRPTTLASRIKRLGLK
ncbi:MAG: sigma 54-interacting transcriptional regulator [Nitrospinae bacterium]|nr:sigma 54-interacting transcriptional regulator [Nitrospinota bacterium]